MSLKNISGAAVIVVTLMSVPAFAAKLRQAGCTYVPSAKFLVLQSVYNMGIEGSKMFQASIQVEPEALVGSRQASIQGGAGAANCKVDFQPVGVNTSTGKPQFQVTYSQCDVAGFLIEEPQQFTCDLF